MRAAVLYGKEQIRIENVPLRPLGPGEVRIRVEAALTCGTDLKVFKRGYHARMIVPPAVFGHELAGVINEVRGHPSAARASKSRGSSRKATQAPTSISEWKVGDRVVVANSAPCGTCLHCRADQENLCDDLLFLNGAYAESVVVPARLVQKNLLRLKPTTSFADAALMEPLACVVQGVEDTNLQAGQRVLVLGAGPIGLMFTALARNLGCKVTVAGRHQVRLQAAKRLGATKVVDVGTGQELAARVQNEVKEPFDAVIEAVGKPEAWEAAVQLVRKGGTVNFFGGCPAGTTIKLDTTLIHYSNLTLKASFHHSPRTVRRALEYIEAGVVHAGDFVNGERPLSELPQLFAEMCAGNQAVKTLICVTA